MGGAFADPKVPRPSPEFAVNLPKGGQVLLSQQRGKVVAMLFVLTTCPHCQNTTVLMSRLQREYGPRGFQVMESAFNEMAGMLVGDFIDRFQPSFPMGYNNRESVMEYVQIPTTVRTYVPIIVFIDRKGIIRAQHTGEDDFFREDQQEKNMRTMIESLLREGGASSSRKSEQRTSRTARK